MLDYYPGPSPPRAGIGVRPVAHAGRPSRHWPPRLVTWARPAFMTARSLA